MVPVLEVLADGETRRLRDLYGLVADHVGLTAAEREEVISSGMLRHHDRIGWAASDLARAKAVERPSRGRYQITDVGRALLREYPQGITQKELRTIPAYTESLAAAQAAKSAIDAPVANVQSRLSPEEQIGQAIDLIHADVADDLLGRLHARHHRAQRRTDRRGPKTGCQAASLRLSSGGPSVSRFAESTRGPSTEVTASAVPVSWARSRERSRASRSRRTTPCTTPKARSRAASEPSQSTSAAAAPGER